MKINKNWVKQMDMNFKLIVLIIIFVFIFFAVVAEAKMRESLKKKMRDSGNLYVHSNHLLTSLSGLNNLTSVGWNLSIISNNALVDLLIDDLCLVGADFKIVSNLTLCNDLANNLKDQIQACPNGGIGGGIYIDNKNCSQS
jgi:hypothetical protein